MGEAAALLDELVGAKLNQSSTARSGVSARLDPPSRPPSRTRPFAQRRAVLEKHDQKHATKEGGGEATVEYEAGAAAKQREELAVAAVSADLGAPPPSEMDAKMDTAMAELRQRLALDVPVPSYLALPSVVRSDRAGA